MVATPPTRDDDRGVAPVIGIVLIVAITVILVGASAVFLLNLGQTTPQPPQSFDHETSYNNTFAGNGEYLNITHLSGNALNADRIHVDVNGATFEGNDTEVSPIDGVFRGQVGDTMTASETLVINRSSFGISSDGVDLSDADVRFVWTPEDEEESHTIYHCEVAYPSCA